jgi:peptide/nickel transport system permease protein
VLYSVLPALVVSVLSTSLALLVGTTLGLIAGYARGALDAVLMRVVDGMLAVPTIALALAIAAVLGAGLGSVILALAIATTPVFGRLVRGQVLGSLSLEYVVAARSMGARGDAVIRRHILPTVLPALSVQASLSMGTALLAEAGLSFLGLGVQPPTATWGGMLAVARGFLLRSPWFAIAPGLALCVTILAFNLLGDGLRDALDPRRGR